MNRSLNSERGKYIQTIGSSGKEDGQFGNSIFGITTDLNGRIYSTDFDNDRVQVFNSDGKFLFKFGSYGNGDAQFNGPRGIKIDSNGNIIIADCFNHRISIFDSNGNYLKSFGSKGNDDGQFKFSIGVCIGNDGSILVVDCNHRIQVFDNQFKFIYKFGSEGNQDGQFSFPTSITMNPQHHILVGDGNGHIQIFKSHISPLEWNPSLHHQFPSSIRNEIKIMMMISLRNPITKEPNHPESFFYLIPKDILFIIARFIATN